MTQLQHIGGASIPAVADERIERPGWIARVIDRDTNGHYRTLIRDRYAAIETIHKQRLVTDAAVHMHQSIMSGLARTDATTAAMAASPSAQALGPDIQAISQQLLVEANIAVTKTGLARLTNGR